MSRLVTSARLVPALWRCKACICICVVWVQCVCHLPNGKGPGLWTFNLGSPHLLSVAVQLIVWLLGCLRFKVLSKVQHDCRSYCPTGQARSFVHKRAWMADTWVLALLVVVLGYGMWYALGHWKRCCANSVMQGDAGVITICRCAALTVARAFLHNGDVHDLQSGLSLLWYMPVGG